MWLKAPKRNKYSTTQPAGQNQRGREWSPKWWENESGHTGARFNSPQVHLHLRPADRCAPGPQWLHKGHSWHSGGDPQSSPSSPGPLNVGCGCSHHDWPHLPRIRGCWRSHGGRSDGGHCPGLLWGRKHGCGSYAAWTVYQCFPRCIWWGGKGRV